MKKIALIIIAIIVAGGAAFYGGMKYQATTAANIQNLSPEARRQMFQQAGGIDGGRNSGARAGGGFTTGEIIAKDDMSITIKFRDGGSKIIFVSATVEVTKSVKGSLSDLEIGKTVSVGGKQNADGSVTAETVQVRPNTLSIPRS